MSFDGYYSGDEGGYEEGYSYEGGSPLYEGGGSSSEGELEELQELLQGELGEQLQSYFQQGFEEQQHEEQHEEQHEASYSPGSVGQPREVFTIHNDEELDNPLEHLEELSKAITDHAPLTPGHAYVAVQEEPEGNKFTVLLVPAGEEGYSFTALAGNVYIVSAEEASNFLLDN